MAGIEALTNQVNGGRQGNPNPGYYRLAAQQFDSSINASCNSSLGAGMARTCIFHDVTTGDIDVPCLSGSPDCYAPSGQYGVLSTSKTSYEKAYAAATGWDFATGLGSVNAYNLVNEWSGATGFGGSATVVEYYDAHDDLYFVTASASEAAVIDGGADNVESSTWSRTGYTFQAYTSTGPGNDVCRFFDPNIPPVGIHFYTALPAECAQVKATLPAWQFESGDVFNIELPTNGVCPSGTIPVYRYFDQRVNESWRFITDPTVEAAMLAKGWAYEGVQMCSPQ
jgi:hypothetical protein